MSQSDTMYKFQLRQVVQLLRAPHPGKNGPVSNEFEIVRLMPADGNGEISYRVKSGAIELAVREHEIKA